MLNSFSRKTPPILFNYLRVTRNYVIPYNLNRRFISDAGKHRTNSLHNTTEQTSKGSHPWMLFSHPYFTISIPKITRPKFLAASLSGVGGIALLTSDKVPFSRRRRIMVLPHKMAINVGVYSAQDITSAYSGNLLNKDDPVYAGVNNIVKKLIDAAKSDEVNNLEVLKTLHFNLVVIDADIVNAFATPDGTIFVFTGFLKIAENIDEVAVILAHEISHLILRHGEEKLGLHLLMQVVSATFWIALEFPQWQIFFSLFRSINNLLIELPNSRACETEADLYGLELSRKAKFDLTQGVLIFKKLSARAEKDKNSSNKYLSTHPDSHDRFLRICQELDRLKIPQPEECLCKTIKQP